MSIAQGRAVMKKPFNSELILTLLSCPVGCAAMPPLRQAASGDINTLVLIGCQRSIEPHRTRCRKFLGEFKAQRNQSQPAVTSEMERGKSADGKC